jgi:ABC-2 type transport system ATP-binding protein
VIDHGRVIARATAHVLKRQVGGEMVEVVVENADDGGRVVEALAHRACGHPQLVAGTTVVTVPVPDLTGVVPAVVRDLDEAGIDVLDVGVRRSTLDDVFFSLTGRPAEDGSGDRTVAAAAAHQATVEAAL